MNKIVEIGFPMEYEDDKHIIRIGMWLKENEVKVLEKRLNKYNHLQSKIDKAIEILNRPQFEYDNIPCNYEEDIKELRDVLKEVE